MAQSTSLGVGLPSISATEVSTTQAVDLVRRRQQEEQGLTLASATGPAPAGQPSTSSGSQTPSSQSAQKSAPKAKSATAAPTTSTAPQQPYAVETYASGSTTRGVWAQGYGEYERRTNLTIDNSQPGAIDSNQYTGGFLAGTDWTIRQSANTGVILGLFAGYNTSNTSESNGFFRARDPVNNTVENFARSAAEQDTTGAFLGGYAAYFRDRFAIQGVFKADIYDVKQSDVILPLENNGQPCGFPATERKGSADLNNYIFEANATYRNDLSSTSWWEPIVGFRFTYSDYSNQSGDLSVGSDGHIWRLQGGARYGRVMQLPRGYLTTTFTGLLYSDVDISGYSNGPGEFSPPTPLTDEGKLRVLGQVAARWDLGNGYSTLFMVEGRGGEDYYAVGGRLGARYEW